jgi:ATP-dependent DNA helicase RecG
MTAAATQTALPPLARLVASLYGVGPERAAQLERLGIRTIEDLLLHRPRRYEDRRQFRPIADLRLEEAALMRGRIVAMGTKWFKQHTRSIFEIIVDDSSARLHCRWWNLPFMEKYFSPGDEVVVFGKPVQLKPRTLDHPETEVVEVGEETGVHLNRITPIYALTEGLPQKWLRALIWRTLAGAEASITEARPGLAEFAAGIQYEGAGLPARARAVRLIHFPESDTDAERARRRLALDEFVDLQRRFQARRRKFETLAPALPCRGDNHLTKPFLAGLGFKLTEAQTRVLRELRQDMSGPHPMRRLLQGDVGCGKTVVAACCSLMALESGYNAVLMAPTEILAEQHDTNFRKWFEPLGIRVELRTGSHKPARRLDLPVGGQMPSCAEGRSSGEGHEENEEGAGGKGVAPSRTLTIGTHALIEDGFEPENLGLVVIDEQHKFGVVQREQLVRKGRYPHLLVMTATPIPRTLGLTVYGDLDLSSIDDLPPGRGRVRTFVRTADKLAKVWAFLREKLGEGRQAYVVYPRVEETGANGVKAVTREFEAVEKAMAPFRAGLLHGRLKAREKDEVMTAFRSGAVQVLLATSLVEVGVDVPNATIMLIENAEQFGLAQLHQLRGRIGRGAHDSYCILLTAAARNKEAQQRLKVLEETTDGFRIAEADLELRGPGEFLGQQQSGAPKFRFGDLTRDWELIRRARDFAARD